MTYLKGLSGAMFANFLWGVSPLYYSKLGSINPMVLLCAQVVLTFLVLTAVHGLKRTDVETKSLLRSAPTAALIGMNWAAYVAAVMHGMALQASVAYLIAPILTLVIAAVVFNEPMTGKQKVGVLLSAAAVVLDVALTNEIPYYGILIALPFAGYIVLHKKTGGASPTKALQIETLVLTPAALVSLSICWPSIAATDIAWTTICVLAFIGVVNALPLALFIRAAPKLSPSQLSACQFIAPITSAVVCHFAFEATIGLAKLLVLSLLCVGMGFAIMPRRLT